MDYYSNIIQGVPAGILGVLGVMGVFKLFFSQGNCQRPICDEFPRFKELPPWIRRKIWRHYFLDTPKTMCMFLERSSSLSGDYFPTTQQEMPKRTIVGSTLFLSPGSHRFWDKPTSAISIEAYHVAAQLGWRAPREVSITEAYNILKLPDPREYLLSRGYSESDIDEEIVRESREARRR